MEPDWLPGCYRNLPCLPGEALPGYLLRLAEANGYESIAALLRAAGINTRGLNMGYSSKLRTDAEALAILGRMAVGDPGHLSGHAAKVLDGPAFFMRECRVDSDALLHERVQVCPQCLAEDGYIKEELELAPVTVCSTHKVLLVDECPDCGRSLDWKRSSLMACGHCGADLRMATPTPVGADVCEVAEDFAALAPFRLVTHGGEPAADMWDLMFRIFKALALPDAFWASTEWPRRVVQFMPVKERHAVVGLLAKARRGGSYFLSDLQPKARAALAPMLAIPRPYVLEQCALLLLQSEAGITKEYAEAMCSQQPLPRAAKGVEIFSGRPPSLRTPDEVAAFLASDWQTVEGLMARKVLTNPIDSEHGYDIDELLAGQTFLHLGVFTLAEMTAIVGVPLDWDDLVHSNFLRPWNSRNPSDLRVAVGEVVSIQMELAAKWAANGRPTSGVLLRDFALRTDRPFQVVSEAVVLALRGDLNPFGWGPRFDWGGLKISEQDERRLSEMFRTQLSGSSKNHFGHAGV
ncbi:TniQ family protein [Thiobacillus denitrificans]|uniref:TniQ family protein n=1 Tax=Thiobacillus denitrificans TaxID=36861 RepID=UPI0003829099|nr:TniQ family protein [Thiobacillus denitrificans]